LLLTGAFSLFACGDTGQARVSYPLFVSGTDAAPFSADQGGWTVTLSEAKLAFGPVFFCASAIASGELCASAQAEFADIEEVDLLVPEATEIGEVSGLSGAINSLVIDYNFTFFVAESLPSSNQDILGGHSAIFRGTATRDADTIDFDVEVDIVPSVRGGFGSEINGVGAEIIDDNARLDVRIDPKDWISGVNFDELLPQNQPGTTLRIEAGSTNHNRILFAMTASETPSFAWSGEGVLP
jgi:hypothetical protein